MPPPPDPVRLNSTRARATARTDVVDDDVVVLGSDLHNTTSSFIHHPRRSRKFSERLLARYLREKLRYLGAPTAIRKHGARRILNALDDMTVFVEWAPGEWHREFEKGIRNPGGFLRKLLEEDVKLR